MKISELCAAKGVKLKATFYGHSRSENFLGMLEWICTLRYQGRRMSLPFRMGPAHMGKGPTVGDVMSCLIMDSHTIDGSDGFEGWCADLGFDSDSRKAERTFKQCEKQHHKLIKLLGEDYDLFMSAESD